jgi:hypothetical protein
MKLDEQFAEIVDECQSTPSISIAVVNDGNLIDATKHSLLLSTVGNRLLFGIYCELVAARRARQSDAVGGVSEIPGAKGGA